MGECERIRRDASTLVCIEVPLQMLFKSETLLSLRWLTPSSLSAMFIVVMAIHIPVHQWRRIVTCVAPEKCQSRIPCEPGRVQENLIGIQLKAAFGSGLKRI